MDHERLRGWWEQQGLPVLRRVRKRLVALGPPLGRMGAALLQRARMLVEGMRPEGRQLRIALRGPGGEPSLELVASAERTRLQELLGSIRRFRERLGQGIPATEAATLRAELGSAESGLAQLLLEWEDTGWLVVPVRVSSRPDRVGSAPQETAAAEPAAPGWELPTAYEEAPSETAVVAADSAPQQEGGSLAGAGSGEDVGAPESPDVREDSSAGGRSVAASEPREAASSIALARLKAHFERGEHVRLDVSEAGPAPWVSALRWLDEELEGQQPGRRVQIIHDFLQGRLAEVRHWPRSLQQPFVGWLSSLLREAQDDYRIRGTRLDRCFSLLTRFSKEEQPGWVPGLSRENGPKTGSWRTDAERWARKVRSFYRPGAPANGDALSPEEHLAEVEKRLARWRNGAATHDEVVEGVLLALRGGVRSDDPRLVRLADPLLEQLEEVGGDARLRSLRRKIRRARRDRGDPRQADRSAGRWSHEELTRDATVLVAGGIPREDARQRLEAGVPFHRVEWPELTGSRSLQNAAARVRSGSYDMVILLTGFSSHEMEGALREACDAAEVPLVRVPSGYGPARVRRSIEAALPVSQEPGAPASSQRPA